MFEHRSQSQKCPIGCAPLALQFISPARATPADSRLNRKSLPPASHSNAAAQLGFAHLGRRLRTMAGLLFLKNLFS
jgi:hypothetical protein